MKKKLLAVLTLTMLLVFSMTQMAWAAGGYASGSYELQGSNGQTFKLTFSVARMEKRTVKLCQDLPTLEDGVYIHHAQEQVVNFTILRRGSSVRITSGLADVGNGSLYVPLGDLYYEDGAYHYVDDDFESAKLYAGTVDDNFASRDGFMTPYVDDYGNPIVFILEDGGSQRIKIKLNGKRLSFPQAPYMANDTTMVPMRAIFEALDAVVEYDAASQKITATKGDTVIELVLGEKAAKKNGEGIALDAPAVTKNGNTMVPLRFVAEALQAQVDWDNASQTITITLE